MQIIFLSNFRNKQFGKYVMRVVGILARFLIEFAMYVAVHRAAQNGDPVPPPVGEWTHNIRL